ncbi:MAG: efflux RND transporter periplasmic adaptor subunit, partial [Bacteroidota bacterium]
MRNKQLAAGCWPLAKNNNKGYFKIISIVNFLKTKIEPHRNIENIALNYIIYVSMWLFNSIKNNILYCNNIGSCKVILQLQKSNSETSIFLHFANINSKIKTILLLIILTTFIACGNNKPEEKEVEATLETVVNLTNDQLKNANIGFGKLEQKTVSSILKVNGKIDVPPQNMVSVSVPLGGYLKSTKLLPGMHVSKGEVIAVMEDQQYIQLQQDYLLAKAKLNFIQNEYNRQKELNQSKASSDKVFQQTESEFISQKITLKSLAEKLKLIGLNPETVNENTISKSINIYSPINGYVTMVNVNIGKYSQPS